MDPGDLLSFLDGPGDLATPPSSGSHRDQNLNDANSQMGLDDVLAQVRALRRGSRGATPLRTTSSPSSTECRPSNLPICATRASSQ